MTLSLRPLYAQFLAWIETHNRPRTVAYYRSFLDRFVDAVGDVPIVELRKHHLLSWGRTWHELQSVQRLFHWAHSEMELIDRNPFATVKRPRPGRRRRVLQRKEIAQLLRAAAPDFRAFLFAMRETIARPQEVRALRWELLRWDSATHTRDAALIAGDARFELHDYKARERRADPEAPRVILVTARLGRLLSRLAAHGQHPDGFIFRNSEKRPWSSNAVRLRVKRLRKRTHLERDARGERLVAYTLRHSSATSATINGVPDRVLAELMGHTSTRTTARYQHLSVAHLRAALARLQTRVAPSCTPAVKVLTSCVTDPPICKPAS
ncbi:MAG TPA: tyrosine-type recombinase/integrase [Candidatus Baltobacteraceae bacterium]|nr:tyrosine-type recombinase/integrase [Candidatus Baltobacteraceae bacterium]